jgi:hypothetical protein
MLSNKIVFAFLISIHSLLAQEKPAWENLTCDSTKVVNKNITSRSIVLAMIQNENVFLGKYRNVFYGIKNQKIIWHSLNDKNNLDSLTKQYLMLLISNENTLFQKWKPWLKEDRKIFIAKRDSLLHDYKKLYPNLKIKVVSDIRTRENQSEIVKKGSSLANLSFHEWGLASDFAIYKNKKPSKNMKYYTYIDSLAQKYDLRWGGKFVGFVDYPHVQLYYNGAKLIQKHPYLAIEYEFFYNQYLQRVRKKIAKNQEFEVEDSKELLVELNLLRKKEVCYCFKENTNLPDLQLPENFNENLDFLILIDEEKDKITIKTPFQTAENYRIGNWQ